MSDEDRPEDPDKRPDAEGGLEGLPPLDLPDDPELSEDFFSLIPDDLSSLLGEQVGLAIVISPVASARLVAGLLRVHGKPGKELRGKTRSVPTDTVVAPTSSGAIVLAHADRVQAEHLVKTTSTVLTRVPLVLVTKQDDRSEGSRWVNGERGDDVVPALLLGAVDDIVERLVLGSIPTDDLGSLPGAITIADLSRIEALKMLASGAKEAREE